MKLWTLLRRLVNPEPDWSAEIASRQREQGVPRNKAKPSRVSVARTRRKH